MRYSTFPLSFNYKLKTIINFNKKYFIRVNTSNFFLLKQRWFNKLKSRFTKTYLRYRTNLLTFNEMKMAFFKKTTQLGTEKIMAEKTFFFYILLV